MVWDLRGALLKKQEIESARLAEFAFRERARTMRLLAAALAIDRDALVRRIAVTDDAAILSELEERFDRVRALHEECRGRARRELIAELGDPTPRRLA